jgi:AraC family transcriptional regulator of adaptative response / DNA-3-methyladenine glycosylase II
MPAMSSLHHLHNLPQQPRVPHITSRPDDDACYLALKARDARFDGCFFTGVTSTRIYCRPVCRVRAPKRDNCRFFSLAAQAEQQGFRPCLRCRPELAPGLPTWGLSETGRVWSVQDSSSILALQAARLLDTPPTGASPALGIAALARQVGVSDRHLRRIFEAHLGVSPLQYLQTRRLLCAKQLLSDTTLPMRQVALLSGFSSVRRFNAVFSENYRMQPTALRSHHGSSQAALGLHVKLAYRPPYDVAALLRFFGLRQVAGLESVSATGPLPGLHKTLRVKAGDQHYSGWVEARFDEVHCQVKLHISDSLHHVVPAVMRQVSAWLDLDADPQAINQRLHARFTQGDGLRVPGTLDGFELAVRAVLGQQITVAASRTLVARLVQQFGEDLETPFAELNRLFPSPDTLAAASPDALGQLGIVKQRQTAIKALAQAVVSGTLQLSPGADLDKTLSTLLALPGLGDWTAQYIAMRALRWPDAFPSGDVALHKALGLQGRKHAAKEALAASQAWQPWRSYAVIRAWAELP